MRILKATKDGKEFYFLEYSKEFIPDILKLHKSTIGDYYSDGEDLYHYAEDDDGYLYLDPLRKWDLIPVGSNTPTVLKGFNIEYIRNPIPCEFLIKGNYDVEEVKEFK